MITKTCAIILMTCSLGTAGLLVQDGEPVATTIPKQQARGFPSAVSEANNNRLTALALVNNENRAMEKRIDTAVEKLRGAESSAERSDAEEELESALSEEYSARLDSYEEYLGKLDEELADMRKRLKRRREAKDEMIALRIKVLTAEAEDLGWPSNLPRNRRFFNFNSNNNVQNLQWRYDNAKRRGNK